MGRRFSKFSKKYSLFLSEASNEEIVSISKELTDEIAIQIRFVNIAAMVVLSISIVALLIVIMLLSAANGPISSFERIIVFLRLAHYHCCASVPCCLLRHFRKHCGHHLHHLSCGDTYVKPLRTNWCMSRPWESTG